MSSSIKERSIFSNGAIKAVAMFALAAVLLFPAGKAIADEVMPAAWFGSTLDLSTAWSGPSRDYDGNNVGIEMTAWQEQGSYRPASDYFSAQLVRNNGWTSDWLGAKSMWRHGFSKVTWEGVGSGN